MVLRLEKAVLHMLFIVLVCTGFAVRPWAQGSSSTGVVIDVTVVDAQGVVPGATVTLINSVTDTKSIAITNKDGKCSFSGVPSGHHVVSVELQGYTTTQQKVDVDGTQPRVAVSVTLMPGSVTATVDVRADAPVLQAMSGERSSGAQRQALPVGNRGFRDLINVVPGSPRSGVNREAYAHYDSNAFQLTVEHPLSTFAADVDTASYTNVRRFLQKGTLPPSDAVQIEELVNYFRFSYPQPEARRPVSVTAEVGPCPWAPEHRLALIGLRAKPIDDRNVTPRNIVLLLDVSGSMMPPERLPLIKNAMRMFVDTLRETDRVAIVVYAGASGVALPPTRGSERERIHEEIEALSAGGSTNGAAGITLAYQVAQQQFVPGGINRVILATDGDFNVGVTGKDDLLLLIQRERQTGIFLSVLGVGEGNLKNSTMEMLADNGNGQYHYLDSLQAARRALVTQGGALLETVAKDVKLQVEFNPAQVSAWKLLGYEKRLMADQDFNDDTKDGGEMGAGHTVTVLYELVPAGDPRPEDGASRRSVDPLIYQTNRATPPAATSSDLFSVKVRYKLPAGKTSALMTHAVKAGGAAPHLPLASAVAEFGLMLRDGVSDAERWTSLSRRVDAITGNDVSPDANDFASLVSMAMSIEAGRRTRD